MENKKEQILSDLCNKVSSCTRCPLSKTRTNTVFGKGGTDPVILFVGEAPGEQEDLKGFPFVGPAGNLLDLYLEYAGLEKKDYYITNILKCRPPRNRDPLPEEEEVCISYLREQVALLSPKILVCLGRVAAKRIIDPDFRITKERGKWFDRGGMRVIATYHPSALLRDPEKKKESLLDFKKILEEYNKLK